MYRFMNLRWKSERVRSLTKAFAPPGLLALGLPVFPAAEAWFLKITSSSHRFFTAKSDFSVVRFEFELEVAGWKWDCRLRSGFP